MSNLTAPPESFSAGTTLTYTRTYADYKPSDGWALTLYLNGKGRIEVNGVPSGDGFRFTIPATDTAALPPGPYRWVERAVRAGVKEDLAGGPITVTLDLATADPGAALSVWERILEVCDAVLEGRITADIEAYQIAGRAVTRIPLAEIVRLRTTAEARVRALRGTRRKPVRIVFSGTENET